ncbi:LOW QUALITY PROTEIN: uncharacterized protein ACR2FA_003575 [Aphomia sociella]
MAEERPIQFNLLLKDELIYEVQVRAKPADGAVVHKLNCRFNGKTCIKAFLQRLDELCLSRGVSEIRLFNSAAELFTEEALCWYRGIRSEVNSWAELKALLLDEYLPADYDHRLLQEIRSRTQGADESIVNYLSIMQNYFSRLSQPLPNQEKLNIVLFNIRPFYTSQLALTPIDSWSELKQQCRLLECARQRSGNFIEPPRVTSSYLAPDLGYRNHKLPVSEVTAVQNATARTCTKCSTTSKPTLKAKVSKKRGQGNRQSGYKYFSANKKCTNPNSKGQQSNVKSVDVHSDVRPFLKIDVSGIDCRGLLDSGSEISIIGNDILKYFTGLATVHESPDIKFIKSANGSSSPVTGYLFLPVTVEGRTAIIKFYVVPGVVTELLLGINFWREFNIAPDVCSL